MANPRPTSDDSWLPWLTPEYARKNADGPEYDSTTPTGACCSCSRPPGHRRARGADKAAQPRRRGHCDQHAGYGGYHHGTERPEPRHPEFGDSLPRTTPGRSANSIFDDCLPVEARLVGISLRGRHDSIAESTVNPRILVGIRNPCPVNIANIYANVGKNKTWRSNRPLPVVTRVETDDLLFPEAGEATVPATPMGSVVRRGSGGSRGNGGLHCRFHVRRPVFVTSSSPGYCRTFDSNSSRTFSTLGAACIRQ